MGLFSNKKKKDKDEFFQSLADDVQKVRENDFMKLSDFSKNDFHKNEESSSDVASPLDSIIKKVSKASESNPVESSDVISIDENIEKSISENKSDIQSKKNTSTITEKK